MTDQDRRPDHGTELRQRAGARAREKAARTPVDPAALSPDETRRTLHELRVVQVELETQNEELRAAQAEMQKLLAVSDQSRRALLSAAEDAREQAEELRVKDRALESSINAIALSGLDGKLTYVNPAFLKMWGYRDRREVEGRSAIEFWGSPDEVAQVMAALQKTGQWSGEMKAARKDSGAVDLEVAAYMILGAGGGPIGMFAAFQDVTTRKRAEAALRESEERYTAIFRGAAEGILVADLETKMFVYANPAICRMLGYSEEELKHLSVQDIHPAESLEHVIGEFESQARGEKSFAAELPCQRKDGSVIYVDVTASAIAFNKRHYLLGFFTDVTVRKQAEMQLAHLHRQHELVLESAAEGILGLDLQGNHTFSNAAAARMLGHDAKELLGTPSHSSWHHTKRDGSPLPAEECAILATLRKGIACRDSTDVFWRKDGTCFPVEYASTPIHANGQMAGAVITFTDITERKLAEAEQKKLSAQLIEAQKMESVGRLAGGVAHDFNNLLQAVLSAAQVGRLLASEGRVAKVLEEIEAHTRRGASLTRQLLLFSRRQPSQREPLDLATLVAQETVMLRRLLPENIALAVETSGEALPLLADAGQLSQVLANLVVNARDAMPDGGRIEIRTLRRNGALVLEVKDTGAGMTADVKEHLFEPFFTTKGLGRGTGLGLAVVFGIVSEHGGRIEVESQLGQGSCLRVVLPARSGEAATAPTEALEDTVPPGRGERLLLVEDEEGSRKALAELLELLDYHVTSVGSGEEAGRLPAEPGFDLLLTDLMLPGITGVDMAAGLVERWPRLVVVVMSGYTADVLDRYKVDSGTMHFLEKPFDLHVLARKLREALGSR